MFFGVPNLGLKYDQLQAMIGSQPNKRLIDDLMLDTDSEPSTYLAELTNKFMHTCQIQSPPFKIISYYERMKSATVEVILRLSILKIFV